MADASWLWQRGRDGRTPYQFIFDHANRLARQSRVPHLGEALADEVFERASGVKYDAALGKPETLIRKIAWRAHIDLFYRRHENQGFRSVVDFELAVASFEERALTAHGVSRIVANDLPPRARQLLQRYFSGRCGLTRKVKAALMLVSVMLGVASSLLFAAPPAPRSRGVEIVALPEAAFVDFGGDEVNAAGGCVMKDPGCETQRWSFVRY